MRRTLTNYVLRFLIVERFTRQPRREGVTTHKLSNVFAVLGSPFTEYRQWQAQFMDFCARSA